MKYNYYKFAFNRLKGRLFSYTRKMWSLTWQSKIVQNVNSTNFKKRCLLRYIIDPFLQRKFHMSAHQNRNQAYQLAQTLGTFEFNVDVVGGRTDHVELEGLYDLIIDYYPTSNPIYKDNVSKDTIKIAYITGSNLEFSNKAEQERLEQVYQRRGQRLKPRRQSEPFEKEILESFDAIFFIGNEYNWRTYDQFDIPSMYFIRNNGYTQFASLDHSKKKPHNFLYLGGSGSVHKGLDLILEIFPQMPELNLYVCSTFNHEKDFMALYQKELMQTDNIYPIGFLDVFSSELEELFETCAFVILPSCSEANSGSVLLGMSAGLIPLISRECGFDEGEAYYFPENSQECIAQTINEFSQKPTEWVQFEAQRMASIVHNKYTFAHYTDSIHQALSHIL